MRTNTPARRLAIISLAFVAALARAASSPVSIEAVSISPQSPGPGVLCTLGVRLKNAGTHTATYFRFKVKIDGQKVATYDNESYAVNVGPGTSETIVLHSFWSPATATTNLPVEVTVLEGRWADVKREGDTSTTTPTGPIEGLPVSVVQSVRMASTK